MLNMQMVHALLHDPLPGALAHDTMSPQPPLPGKRDRLRHAAVLVLLCPAGNRPLQSVNDVSVTLIGRAHSTHHAHELAFPGGLREKGESLRSTALREAHEEVGVTPDSVSVLGTLTRVSTATSGTVILPVLAVTRGAPVFRANEEVARVMRVPLRSLCETDARRVELSTHPELGTRQIPYFAIGSKKLWGASAKIMAELLAIVYGEEFLARQAPYVDHGAGSAATAGAQ